VIDMGRGGRARAAVLLTVPACCALLVLSGCGMSNGMGNGTTNGMSSASQASTRSAAASDDLDTSAVPPCPATKHVAPRAGGLPALTLPCLGAGPSVRLSDLRGTPMVLNIWAAWCSNCADEAPLFTALHAKAGDRLRFFGIHYQADRRFGLAAARDFDMFFPSVHDADGAATIKALKAPAPPETWFVTADGKVAYRHRGVLTSQGQLDSYVGTYLGVHV
jgi:cytochrome c biogenesis protein CcmG, thiol:disulfide interchange protein DsbE